MQRAVKIAIVVGAVVLVAVYFLYDPRSSNLFPKCTFLMLTGYRCPGCGSQRMLHALLRGDLAAAWHYNALLLTSLPVLAVYVFSHFTRERYPKLYSTLNHKRAVTCWVVVVIAWWILRNIFGW